MAERQAVMSQRSECGGAEEFDSVMKLFILWPLEKTWLLICAPALGSLS